MRKSPVSNKSEIELSRPRISAAVRSFERSWTDQQVTHFEPACNRWSQLATVSYSVLTFQPAMGKNPAQIPVANRSSGVPPDEIGSASCRVRVELCGVE